jgi:dCMP deaminase
MRPSKDAYYLNIALMVATRSTCIRRKYGAVIVKNDRIISTGYNGAARGEDNCCDIGECERQRLNIPQGERYELCRAVHAEANAIINGNPTDMIGATLYLNGIFQENPQPCAMCQRMIANAQIARVVTTA